MPSLQSHLSHPKYRKDIDGLRAVAVLAVVLYHAFPEMLKGGFTGVDVFFVISGFLISTIIFENLEKNTFSFTEFYARRIKRIFPALFLVLTACYVFGWFVLLADEYKQLGKHIASGAVFISNITLWNEAGYFDNSAETKPLLHLWSLGIEEQFYIAWPLLLWAAWKRKFNLLTLTIIFALASFYLNVRDIKVDPVATFYAPQTRFWELLCGSLLAWITLYKQSVIVEIETKFDGWIAHALRKNKSKENDKILSNLLAFIGFFLLLYGCLRINKELSFPGKWALVPVLGAVFLIFAGPNAWVNRVVLSNRFAVWFGLISFPLYLWHWPLLCFIRIVDSELPTSSIRLVAIIFSILFAWLTYKFVETPLRFVVQTKATVLALLLLALAVGVLGYITCVYDGFASRSIVRVSEALFTPKSRQLEQDFAGRYITSPRAAVSESSKPIILILGDSYVPNWAAALSSKINVQKYDVVSLSYLGCDVKFGSDEIKIITKTEKNQNNCNEFNTFMNNPGLTNRVTAVMLASHRPFEYEKNIFRFEILRWLKQRNHEIELFVLGNYFQLDPQKYPSCEKLMLRSSQGADICLKLSNYPIAEIRESSAALYPKDLEFKYVDLIKLHCAYDKKNCQSQSQGVPFMLDWNHLSAVFIESLLTDLLVNHKDSLDDLDLLKFFVNTPPV